MRQQALPVIRDIPKLEQVSSCGAILYLRTAILVYGVGNIVTVSEVMCFYWQEESLGLFYSDNLVPELIKIFIS